MHACVHTWCERARAQVHQHSHTFKNAQQTLAHLIALQTLAHLITLADLIARTRPHTPSRDKQMNE